MIKTPVNAIFHEDTLALDSCLLTVSPHRLSLVCAHKVWRGEKSEVGRGRERELFLMSLLIRTSILLYQGSTFMTSFNLFTSLEAPLSNSALLRVRALTWKFWRNTNIQSITPTQLKMSKGQLKSSNNWKLRYIYQSCWTWVWMKLSGFCPYLFLSIDFLFSSRLSPRGGKMAIMSSEFILHHLLQWKKVSPYQLFHSDSQDCVSFSLFEHQAHSQINYIDQEVNWSDLGKMARARLGADMSDNMGKE